MKKISTQTDSIPRRSFLKGAVVAGAAIGAGAANGVAHAETAEEAPVKTRSKGYRETGHIREYYRLARF